MTLEVLTHTKRRNWANCPRYYLHSHLQHLTPRIQKTGRRRGSIFGNALEFVRVNKDVEGFDLRQAINYKVDQMYDELIDTGNYGADQIPEFEMEAAKMHIMVECYINRYGHDARRELEFNLPLVGPNGEVSERYRLGGKIDGIARTDIMPDGTKMATLIEDKLVQTIQKAMILRLPLDAQASEYICAFIAQGWDAKMLYRHTKWPGINLLAPKQFKTKADYPGETLAEFEDRLYVDVAEDPGKYFDEQNLYFPKEHLDDYRAGRWGIAQQIERATDVFRSSHTPAMLDSTFPMNSSRCWEWGGCEFIPLCTKQPGAEHFYEVKAENPELSDDHGEGITSEYGSL